MPGTFDDQTRQALLDAFGALHQNLQQAYWAATSIEAQDRIRGIKDLVYDTLTDLNRADIQSHDDALAQLIKGLAQAKGKIDELQGQIDLIIHNLKLAGEVIEAIKTASTAAATALARLQG